MQTPEMTQIVPYDKDNAPSHNYPNADSNISFVLGSLARIHKFVYDYIKTNWKPTDEKRGHYTYLVGKGIIMDVSFENVMGMHAVEFYINDTEDITEIPAGYKSLQNVGVYTGVKVHQIAGTIDYILRSKGRVNTIAELADILYSL